MTAIAVAGAGLIGKRHLAALRTAGIRVHSVIDPAPEAAAVAAGFGVPHLPDLAAGLAARPDGLILATPNAHHAEGALAAIAAGVPVLVEKPLAVTLEEARAIVEAGDRAGVPVLTGHHRRHLPVYRTARDRIAEGALGTVVAAHAMVWLAKPDGYFDVAWRRAPGAGPLLVNLIHEIDMLRFLLGEIAEVRALASNRIRGHAVEDSAAALLSFATGALGTVQVSDTIVAPWSHEMTAHENPAYPPTPENAMFIGGTHASLALPRGEEWSDGGRRDWWAPISRTTLIPRPIPGGTDPFVAQAQNFAAVIRGEAAPVCSGQDGLRALATVLAIGQAASEGTAVPVAG